MTPLLVLPLLAWALALLPGGAQAYYGHRRHQGPTGHLRANSRADNYTCYHAPAQPGVRVLTVGLDRSISRSPRRDVL